MDILDMIETCPHTVYMPIVQRKGKRLPLGTCVHPSYWRDPRYLSALSNYKVITPEVAGGWWWVYGGDGYPAHGWGDMDAIYQFAQDNGQRLISYPLRWWYPDARIQPPDIEAWITEVMERYPLIMDWQVVNEGWTVYGIPTIAQIDESYQTARKVRWGARLWYNGILASDYEQEQVMRLVEEGLVDCVGIQCHHDLKTDHWPYAWFVYWMRKNHVPWAVTELDVCIPDTEPETLEAQAAMYANTVTMCRDYGAEFIATWGVADCVSWKRDFYPLPLDVNYQPKPAWRELTGE